MKIFLKIFACLFCLFFAFGNVLSYDLSEKDYALLDTIEEKLYDKIDNSNIQPEMIISALQKIIQKP